MPTDPERWKKNTKEQNEMLGRFVEAFELMVNEVRELCLFLASAETPFSSRPSCITKSSRPNRSFTY
jgi:hypothetical protein